ncbi:MAG: zinc ribbon domain-containing protein [Acidimicrobiia bacterium]
MTADRGRKSDEYEEFDLEDRPTPLLNRMGDPLICPSCGASNPPNNRHCEECGARLRQGPLPAAPRPAVQATAGVRAVVALSGLLGVVILAAFLINLFSDEDPASTTTVPGGSTTTTNDEPVVPGQIAILRATCVPVGLEGAFGCSNLIDESDAEFQLGWNDLPANEQIVTITLTFAQPMVVEKIIWTNIADDERFRRNYRAKSLIIEAEGNPVPHPQELRNEPGLQEFNFAVIRSNDITITILSVYPAEVVGEFEPFDELAINEITVVGYPALDTSTTPSQTTVPTTASN